MDPPDWTMDPPGVEPAEGGGGGVRIKWLNHLKGTFRCDKSLRHQNDCPQYIPKGKQTPASKLAFVITVMITVLSHDFFPVAFCLESHSSRFQTSTEAWPLGRVAGPLGAGLGRSPLRTQSQGRRFGSRRWRTPAMSERIQDTATESALAWCRACVSWFLIGSEN